MCHISTVIYLTTLKTRIITDNTGDYLELPVLYPWLPPLLDYQRLFSARSLSWHRDLCCAVRLCLEYAAANAGCFSKSRELFESFSIRLRGGTVGPDGMDPSGLYWRPKRRAQANTIIVHLTQFSAWLSGRDDVPAINPLRDATRHEQVIAGLAWAHRNKESFLGHTASEAKAREDGTKTPWVPRQLELKVIEKRPRFPEEKFLPLITEGFANDYRGALITTLLHGAGNRTSEAFHGWFDDVVEDPADPTVALVRIGHPEKGFVVVGDNKCVTRREYLRGLGLRPRNLVVGSQHAGWKNPTLDGKWFLASYWSDPAYGRLFLTLWRKYLQELANLPLTLPWAWVNFRGKVGSPYTMHEYSRAHAAAVRRIGLEPRKSEGTTSHGHRHACLYRLKAAQMDSLVIKRVAHQHSLASQEVYTEAEQQQIRTAITTAYERLGTDQRLEIGPIIKKLSEPKPL